MPSAVDAGIPGVRYLPIIGDILSLAYFFIVLKPLGYDIILLGNQKVMNSESSSSFKRGNVWGIPPLIGKFLSPRRVILSDPKCVEHILKSNFENYPKGDHLHEMLYPFFGDGIFNVDGTAWKRQR
jgi:hypothetical protein